MPFLSFIVPAHNEENELPATLRALQAAAEASKQPYEVIVAADACTDRTAEIAASFGAIVVPVNLRQIAGVRNAGARAARGEVFFFVDADTQISPGHVTAALREVEAGCSGGSARITLDGKIPPWAHLLLRVFGFFYYGANLGVGAFMFMRRENFEKAGGFDEQYFAGEEMYLTISLKEIGPFRILPEPIVTSARKVRMHSGWHVLKQWVAMLLGGKKSLRARDKLALWYDGKREEKPA